MNRFKKHIPSFVDTDQENPWYEFETTDDLLNLEVVKQYREEKEFCHFALADDSLMAVTHNGYRWHVVGYIEKSEEIFLPKWEPKK